MYYSCQLGLLCMCCCCLIAKCVSDSFATPQTVAHQAILSMGFPRQEYWQGLPFPFPGVFLTQGLNPCLLSLLHCRQILYSLSHQESLYIYIYIYILEKATHSSILAWRIPWKEEPGRLQSMGSQRVGYDWMTNMFTFLSLWSHSCNSLPSFPFPICQNLTHLLGSLLCLNSAPTTHIWASQVAVVVKNPPANAGDLRDRD